MRGEVSQFVKLVLGMETRRRPDMGGRTVGGFVVGMGEGEGLAGREAAVVKGKAWEVLVVWEAWVEEALSSILPHSSMRRVVA